MRDEDPVQQSAEKSMRAWIAFLGVFKKVLLEAAPSVYVSIVFSGLLYDHMEPLTRVRVLLTVAFSIATILQKAVKCFGLGLLANIVGAFLILLAVGSGIKLVMTCVCQSHIFLLTSMRCLEDMASPTSF
mmetsp:Transcript_107436/g.278144  ORF Transcript_107436/g.278144 Transcript_107436/m.278144 type:complete len:130 (+) Transcript_107436:2-391(+)